MSSLRITKSTYNLFYIFFCIVWTPIQVYYLHVDGAGRSIMLLSIIAFLLNLSSIIKRKSLFLSAPFICWSLLTTFSFLNSMIKGFIAPYGLFVYINVNFFAPYIFLMIAIIEMSNNINKCLKIVLTAQLLYIILGSMHISTQQFDRSTVEGLGNGLPLMAACTTLVSGLLLLRNGLKGGWKAYIFILLFVLVVIIIAATRKALGAVIIVLIGVVLGRKRNFSPKQILNLGFIIILIYIGMTFIMEHTYMGERFVTEAEKYDVPLSSIPVVNDFLMKVLGDRSVLYYMSIQLFHQHPITGIGLNNFMEVSQYSVRIHSEYMVQLCENGLVGFSLLVLFYLTMFKGIIKKNKEGANAIFYFFALAFVLFINLTAWTYNAQYIMIIYAIIISYTTSNSKSYQNENSYTSSRG